ncbi:solute carrier family 35 member SLC35F1/F2/F6 [Chlamydoabsidia padenii]|nr:solute carrier family 35 member SLC35F1/F2/F6 [Chlamydoabsidia padenii]
MISKYINIPWLSHFFFAQALSICYTITSTISSALWQYHHINIPFTQMTAIYFLMTLIHGTWHYYDTKHNTKQYHFHQNKIYQRKRRAYNFFLVILYAIFDVQVNSLSIIGFKHTSLLSALIICSWNLPCTMLLSSLLLCAKYTLIHYWAVNLCLIGIGFSIWSDTIKGGMESTSGHTWLGDLIFFCCATLYATSTVIEEYLVHYFDIHDLLYRIGLAGMIQSSALMYYFEWDTLASIAWCRNSVILALMYVFVMIVLNTGLPIIFRTAGATFVSVNLTTGNFYSLLMGIYFLDAKMTPLYPLAYILVMAGVLIYNFSKAPDYHQKHKSETRSHYPDENQPLLDPPPLGFIADHHLQN